MTVTKKKLDISIKKITFVLSPTDGLLTKILIPHSLIGFIHLFFFILLYFNARVLFKPFCMKRKLMFLKTGVTEKSSSQGIWRNVHIKKRKRWGTRSNYGKLRFSSPSPNSNHKPSLHSSRFSKNNLLFVNWWKITHITSWELLNMLFLWFSSIQFCSDFVITQMQLGFCLKSSEWCFY